MFVGHKNERASSVVFFFSIHITTDTIDKLQISLARRSLQQLGNLYSQR